MSDIKGKKMSQDRIKELKDRIDALPRGKTYPAEWEWELRALEAEEEVKRLDNALNMLIGKDAKEEINRLKTREVELVRWIVEKKFLGEDVTIDPALDEKAEQLIKEFNERENATKRIKS